MKPTFEFGNSIKVAYSQLTILIYTNTKELKILVILW